VGDPAVAASRELSYGDTVGRRPGRVVAGARRRRGARGKSEQRRAGCRV